MQFGISTPIWIDGLLTAAKQFLVTNQVYNQDAIWTYLGDPTDFLNEKGKPPRDAFCVVSAPKATPNPSVIAGGGNFTPVLKLTATFTQFQRLFSDRAEQDTQRIEKASLGLAQQAQKLFTAFQMWTGQAGGTPTTSPLFEPARLVGDLRFTGRRIPLGWGAVDSVWEIPFQASLANLVAVPVPPPPPPPGVPGRISPRGW